MKRDPVILFEDDAIIAYDKPAGLLIAPDRWNRNAPNLMDWVHRKGSPDWYNVHRLDRDTSGVLLCAKNKAALDRLSEAFEKREVKKQYLALVAGTPREEAFTVRLKIAPDPQYPGRVRAHRSYGKPAETQFAVARRWQRYALIQARPLTGRTHQIRVHLAAVGLPLIADPFYGDGHALLLSSMKKGYRQKAHRPEIPLMGRTALHAERLELEHPVTGEPMVIEAPLPKDFQVAFKYLDRYGRPLTPPETTN